MGLARHRLNLCPVALLSLCPMGLARTRDVQDWKVPWDWCGPVPFGVPWGLARERPYLRPMSGANT